MLPAMVAAQQCYAIWTYLHDSLCSQLAREQSPFHGCEVPLLCVVTHHVEVADCRSTYLASIHIASIHTKQSQAEHTAA